jgi:hypothetical protein
LARQQPVDGQKYDRPEGGYRDGPDIEPTYPAAAKQTHRKSTDESTVDPYEYRDYDAARAVSRHEELAQSPGYQTYYDPAYDPRLLDAPFCELHY